VLQDNDFVVHTEEEIMNKKETKSDPKPDHELLEIFWHFLSSEQLNSVLSGYFLNLF
jgi:hypothetical protein